MRTNASTDPSGARPRAPLARVGASLVGSALVLWIGNRILDPAPLSSATGIGLGLLGLWWYRRSRLTGLVVGLVLGLLVGVAGHWRVHATGGSPAPDEGLLAHFAVDALRGSYVALPALLIAFWIVVGLGRARAE